MMKKFGKGLMLLALAASMVFGFVACGGDDDEKEDTPTLTTFTQEGGTGTLKVYDLEKGKGDFEMTVDSTTSKGTWERGEGTAIKCTTSDGEEITGSITVDQDGTVTSVTVTISANVSYTFVRNAESEEEEEEEEEESNIDTSVPYVLDITSVNAEGTTQKIDNVVTVISTASGKKIKYNNTAGKLWLEMGGGKAATTYGFQLTLPKAATIKVKAIEKKAENNSKDTKLVLLDKSGTVVVTSTASVGDYGTNESELTDITLEAAAGTYIFGAEAEGCFIYSFVINWKE